jgi:hypothetical protein
MRIRTAIFGTLRLTEKLPVEHVGTAEFVRWSPALRFPGLIDRQRLFIRLSPVARGRILAADGGQLSPNAAGDSPLDAAGATIAGGLASASGRMVRRASG